MVLHEVSERIPERPEKPPDPVDAVNSVLFNTTRDVLYLDRLAAGRKVLLKLSRVLLRNGDRVLETFAILDEG